MSLRNIVLLLGAFTELGHAAPPGRVSDGHQSFLPISATATTRGQTGVQYCGKADEAPAHTYGDPEVGPGFWITNHDGMKGDYFIYENSRDERPWKYITIENGDRRFVQVCPTWQGHIARGTASTNLDGNVHNLGTWFQANIDENGWIWGSVSFLQGCDGGGTVRATDESEQLRGCTEDILAGAPETALATKGSGAKVLDRVVGEGASVPAEDWMLEKCSIEQVYIQAGGYNPVIKSENGVLEWVFSQGKF